jgi:hypothetical protein
VLLIFISGSWPPVAFAFDAGDVLDNLSLRQPDCQSMALSKQAMMTTLLRMVFNLRPVRDSLKRRAGNQPGVMPNELERYAFIHTSFILAY